MLITKTLGFTIILIIVLAWVFFAYQSLANQIGHIKIPGLSIKVPRSWLKWLPSLIDDPTEAATVLAVVGIVVAIYGYRFLYIWEQESNLVGDFYANVAAEFISIAITVLIIERLNERRNKKLLEQQEKNDLILQFGSPDKAFAVEAARKLRVKGWLADGSLSGAELSGASLSGTDLSKANLYGANLNEADLTNVNFTDANLEKISIKNAKLAHVNLHGANLYGTNLLEAKLELDGANLVQANFKEVDLTGVNLTKANLSGANLEKTDLTNTNLTMANLKDVNAKGTNFRRANLIKANLDGINLDGANLSEARYDSNTKWPQDFGYQYSGAIGPKAKLSNIAYPSINLAGVDLNQISLKNANLMRANLEKTNFEGANLVLCSLEGANLEGANLMRADLDRVNLRNANLVAANLEYAELHLVSLKGAIYTDETKWPQNFDTQTAGVILVFDSHWLDSERQLFFIRLRGILSILYEDKTPIRRIVADSGLNTNKFDFNGTPENIWHGILLEAEKLFKIKDIIDIAYKEYQGNHELVEIRYAYLTLPEIESSKYQKWHEDFSQYSDASEIVNIPNWVFVE